MDCRLIEQALAEVALCVERHFMPEDYGPILLSSGDVYHTKSLDRFPACVTNAGVRRNSQLRNYQNLPRGNYPHDPHRVAQEVPVVRMPEGLSPHRNTNLGIELYKSAHFCEE